MIRVKGGVFVMGSEDLDACDWEKPVHQVKLDGFCITSWSSKR
ncbi:MAG: SUMF1/EgtB/PvdO family nonheme iron enzyme [Lewinellaceae bacterium]|nr:SUMF1/EgtB/PvdO family nonheme iron enzyme [Phaeodactylibacter sp.]MCB9036780.1 SUMF1/EgtB/PvdO family nonheme iron enzyme [Lewinellaceae bacterium]